MGCYTVPVLRVFLLEDERWVREAVTAVIQGSDELQLAATCRSVAEAERALAGGVAFDVGLIDLGLPDGSGLQVLPQLRAANPEAGLVAFTVFDEPETVFGALRAGARGYLLKSTPLSELPRALCEVAQGGAPMSPAVARLVVDSFAAPGPPTRPALSPRERDVLRLLALGHTYADVGRALDIGLGTVQSHVKTLYEKLHVASKAEAAVAALKLGLA